MTEATPPGYTATVHRSLLMPLRLVGVPFKLLIANAVHLLVVLMSFHIWRYTVVALALHGFFWLTTRNDAKRLEVLWRFLSYDSYYGVDGMATPSPLFKKRRRAKPFGGLTPWGRLIDHATGLHSTKTGGLFCTFRLKPKNAAAMGEAEQGALMLQINDALKRLDESWSAWVHARRREDRTYPDHDCTDPVLTLLDDEWRAHLTSPGRLWKTEVYLTLHHKPLSQSSGWANWLFYGDRRRGKIESLRETFEAGVIQVTDLLSLSCERLDRLDGDALFTFLKPFVSVYEHPVVANGSRRLTGYQLADGGAWVTTRPTMGPIHDQHHIRCLSLHEEAPAQTQALFFKELNTLPVPFDWVQRIRVTARQEAEKTTTNQQLNWDGMPQGWRTQLHETFKKRRAGADPLQNTHIDQQIRDADAARAAVLSDQYRLTKLTGTWTTKAATAAEATANIRAIQRVMHRHGFIPIDEDLNCFEAYLGTFPGELVANVRELEVTTHVAATLGPWHAPYQGEPWTAHLKGPALTPAITEQSMRYDLNTHVHDVGIYTLIGPFGSGKSTDLNWFDVMWLLRYAAATVTKFDHGRAGRCLTLCLGGKFYDLSRGEAPLQIMAGLDDDVLVGYIYQWLVNRVQEYPGLVWDPDIGKFLMGGIDDMRAHPQIPRRLKELLYVLTAHMNKSGGLALAQKNKRAEALALVAPRVIAALEPFAEGGMFGRLVDAAQETTLDARIVTYEMEEFLKRKAATAATLELLYYRERQRVDGHPIRRDYDEAWDLFTNETCLSMLEQDFPGFRKYNITAGFATQSISQIKGTRLTAFLKESAKTRLWLPNGAGLEGDVLDLYLDMGLSRHEIDWHIVRAEPMNELYVAQQNLGGDSRQKRAMISLKLQPLAVAICGASSEADHHLMDEILDHHGPDEFAVYWLDAKGYTDAAKQVARGLLRAHEETRHEPVLALLSAD